MVGVEEASGFRLGCRTAAGQRSPSWQRCARIEAPCVLDGPINGRSFLAYVEQVLVPTLKKGDIVFMDNVRTHKVVGVREAIEAAGARLRYLPAYSPDLNPIENAYAKIKSDPRKAPPAPSTHSGSWSDAA